MIIPKCSHCGKLTLGRCSVCNKPVCEKCWHISRNYHVKRGHKPKRFIKHKQIKIEGKVFII
jgi:hypothetical protein